MEIKSYRDLIAWQKAMNLVTECYQITDHFPVKEQFGLSSQMRRAAVSVPANIAEGHGRKSTGAFLNHLSIANGSLAELETHIEISTRLNYVTAESVEAAVSLLQETRRILNGLIKSLRRSSPES